MLKTNQLKKSFFYVLIISLIIPFLFGLIYLSTSHKNSLLKEFHYSQKTNAITMADIISTPIWFYELEKLKNIADKYNIQNQIKSIKVEDINTKKIFYLVEKKDKCFSSSKSYTLEIPINIEQKDFKPKTIATLFYTYSSCQIDKTLKHNIYTTLIITILQFLTALGFLTWLLNIKVIKPANILVKQSKLTDTAKLFTNLSHQWRQPLSELSNYLINIRTILFIKEEKNLIQIEDLLQKSEDVVVHLSETIDTFKEFYKNDDKKIKFYLYEAIEESLSLIDKTLKSESIHIEFNTQNRLIFNGYKNDLIHVIINLFSNSLDVFIQRKIKYRSIKLSIYKDNDAIFICFEDNGGGVKIKPIDDIFELHISSKDYNSGLGLYMSRELLKNNKGTIAVENTKVGVKFIIKLQTT